MRKSANRVFQAQGGADRRPRRMIPLELIGQEEEKADRSSSQKGLIDTIGT